MSDYPANREKEDSSSELLDQAIRLEREAHHLKEEGKVDQAFYAFDRAGSNYRQIKEPFKAAICFASAASCWNIHTGRQPLRNAATRNESAAHEALVAGHFSYARSLFREAALLYELEGNYHSQSLCFYAAQNSHVRHLWSIFWKGRESEGFGQIEVKVSWVRRLYVLLRSFLGLMSLLIWGHGEKPFRTILTAGVIIVASAVVYVLSGLVSAGGMKEALNFFEGLYFSVVTYTTLGYGDLTPLGWARGVAMFEALSGIILTPLFLVALSRRYLRIYH
ncbi:MAG: hypothetical protein JW893_04110 [Candidatus Omnitrophica bacterium]|nr:hypothetical protein [Candidatus Omnitrophota bacterium]